MSLSISRGADIVVLTHVVKYVQANGVHWHEAAGSFGYEKNLCI